MGEPERHEIAVIGGGPTGCCAALLLADAGYDVLLVAPPAPDDGRSVALLHSSLEILETLGLRDEVAAAGAPLAVMRLVDDTGSLLRAPEICFRASELDLPAFGYSVMTADLTRLLRDRADSAPALTLVDAEASRVRPASVDVEIETDAGRTYRCALVVGADGVRSRCREAAGLEIRPWSYRQKALVTTFRHSLPHAGVSTEFHTRAGPFTLVPVGDHRSGLVWVDRPEVIDRWTVADLQALAGEIERRSHFILGDITVEREPKTTPMAGGFLAEPAARRIALIGEAAHFFPPIGAQGLNLGLRDCAALARAVGRHNSDPGSAETLARYVRARRLDVAARTWGVDLLNRSLLYDFLPVQAARALGMGLADSVGPLRRMLMRVGLAHSPLPWGGRP